MRTVLPTTAFSCVASMACIQCTPSEMMSRWRTLPPWLFGSCLRSMTWTAYGSSPLPGCSLLNMRRIAPVLRLAIMSICPDSRL